MTAGMAARRPSAVANKASARPGATTARLVFFEIAIAWNEFMIPHTVPNRPTKGAVEPTVASTRSRLSSCDISSWSCTSMTFSMRFCTPWKPARMAPSWLRLLHLHVQHLLYALLPALEAGPHAAVLAALPLPHRGDEKLRHAAHLARPDADIKVLERLPRPEHALEPVGGADQPVDDQDLLDDDRPADHRCGDQPHHDKFDKRRRLPEQVPKRCVAGIERNLSRFAFHSSPFHWLPRMRRISKATVSKLRPRRPALIKSTA